MPADFILNWDATEGQLYGEDPDTGRRVPIPLEVLEAGHDDVRVPQVRNLTVEDWESGTLDTDVWSRVRGGSDVSVSSNVVADGNYSLEITHSGTTDYRTVESYDGLDTYPQAGDEFDVFVYFTDSDDYFGVGFCVQDFNKYFEIPDGFSLDISPYLGKIRIKTLSDTAVVSNTSPPLNEFVRANVSITLEGNVEVSVYDSSEKLLGSGSFSPPADEKYKSGAFGFRSTNFNTASKIYVDMPTGGLRRREPEARANTAKGVTELGNEVVPSGSIQTGPQTASTNATRAVYQDAPVDSTATQGTESLLTMLQSGVNPAMYMERTMDGQGGAYGHQLQTALGRFARINANLSWEYDTFSDVPNYIVGGPAHSASVNGYPRKLRLSTTGSGGGFGGIAGTPIISPQSLGSFRVTFHGVNSTRSNTDSGVINIGLGDSSVTTDMDTTSHTDNFHVRDDSGGSQRIRAYSNGSLDAAQGTVSVSSFGTGPFDLSFDVRPSEGTITVLKDGGTLVDGTVTNVPLSNYGALRPIIQSLDKGTAHDTDVQQITVEPLSEVLQ